VGGGRALATAPLPTSPLFCLWRRGATRLGGTGAGSAVFTLALLLPLSPFRCVVWGFFVSLQRRHLFRDGRLNCVRRQFL
jgi:hypothetical protein